MYSKAVKVGGGVVLALILTTFSIDATDTLSGKGGTMLASLVGTQTEICPVGMIHIPGALTFTCVDKFESSAHKDCPVNSPLNEFDTEINLSNNKCEPVSEVAKDPWRFVDREQSAVLCTRAGKRLPSTSEWYQFALGSTKDSCNVSGGDISTTGEHENCLSAAGVFDAVGNVWEWVSDDVIEGVYQGRELPREGYVVQVDSAGMATITTEETQAELRGDYFWMSKEGAFGIIRGGFYGSKEDAGTYTVHAQTPPNFSGVAVGFRCVK